MTSAHDCVIVSGTARTRSGIKCSICAGLRQKSAYQSLLYGGSSGVASYRGSNLEAAGPRCGVCGGKTFASSHDLGIGERKEMARVQTPRETAAILGIPAEEVWRLTQSGALRTVKLGDSIYSRTKIWPQDLRLTSGDSMTRLDNPLLVRQTDGGRREIIQDSHPDDRRKGILQGGRLPAVLIPSMFISGRGWKGN